MKKTIIYIASAILALNSCSFLTVDETVYLSKDYQFSTFGNVKKVATNVYSYVVSGLNNVEGTMSDVGTDNAVYAWEGASIKRFWDGSWSSTRLIDDVWSHYYAGIAAANYFLENCPEDFPEAQYLDDYKQNLAEMQIYPYEVRLLRAYFHFELLKRYNRIPLVDHQLALDEVNSLVPSSYDDVTEWIVTECDELIPLLPDTYTGTYSGEIMRVTKGCAQALKVRALLYAASPLNNPDNDQMKWFRAAAAAKDIIDGHQYEMVMGLVGNNQKSHDLIFGIAMTPSASFESANFPIGYEGGNSGICPSENLAECFELKDGTPFDYKIHKDKLFDLSARDPRMANTILVNGAKFKNEIVETFYGGRHGLPKAGGTPTSYYIRKFIQQSTSFEAGASASYAHVYPIFRYPEMLLAYAEALFYATGNPSYKGVQNLETGKVQFNTSPIGAVNIVRSNAGMPDISKSIKADDFEARLRNEWRVEFAFEDHRFWDIRRWMIGPETTQVYGLEIKDASATSVEKKVVEAHYWDDKMYFYPVSQEELYKNRNLLQNDGW